MEKRFLAVDLGEKRVGVAVTDPLNILSQRFTTLQFKTKEKLAEDLNEIIKEKNIGTVVFGLPLTLSDKESQKTIEVKALADFLKTKFPDDILTDFEDEALTTVEAHEIIRNMGKKPSKNKELVDQVAAQRILESYRNRTRK